MCQHCQYMCIQMLYAVYVYHMNIMFWLCTVKGSRCLFSATCFPASDRIWGSDSCTSSDYWWWWRSSDEHVYVPIQRIPAAGRSCFNAHVMTFLTTSKVRIYEEEESNTLSISFSPSLPIDIVAGTICLLSEKYLTRSCGWRPMQSYHEQLLIFVQ